MNRMSENVLNIRRNRKLNHVSYGKLERGTSNKRRKTCRGKNPKKYLPGSLFSLICNGNDVPKLRKCTEYTKSR